MNRTALEKIVGKTVGIPNSCMVSNYDSYGNYISAPIVNNKRVPLVAHIVDDKGRLVMGVYGIRVDGKIYPAVSSSKKLYLFTLGNIKKSYELRKGRF